MVIDKSDMKSVLTNFPKQCREALALAQGIKVSTPVENIIVAGLGGSGIGGDILKSLIKTAPVEVIKSYDIPEYTSDKTLMFAISYSGNTEETLSAVTQAKNRNAHVITITSGGQLSELGDSLIRVPQGLQPRNAVGYLFLPILGVLFNSGLIKVTNADMNDLIQTLSDTEYFDEKGHDLAKKIGDRTPIIYSSADLEACAYRFKCEINENAKHPAAYHVFPELCHNELVGFEGMERSKFIIFMMRSSTDHERIRLRMDICKELFDETVDVEELTAMGTSQLAKIFSLIYLGDWTSYHLAMAKRVDPTPVHVIENLKRKLLE